MLLCRAPAEGGAWVTEGCKWGGQGGEAQHELAVVVGEANETANLSARCRLGPLCDGSDLARVDGDEINL